MSYEYADYRAVMFVRWLTPEMADVGKVIESARRIRTAQRLPVVLIAICPEDSKPPPGDVLKAMGARMSELYAECDSFHAVMEGTGFGSAVRRTAVAGVVLIAGRRGQFHVHANIDQVPQALSDARGHEVSEAIRYLRTTGYLRPKVTPAKFRPPQYVQRG